MAGIKSPNPQGTDMSAKIKEPVHRVVSDLVDAEKSLQNARAICSTPRVIELIDSAFNKIWGAADNLAPEVAKEIRENKTDPLM